MPYSIPSPQDILTRIQAEMDVAMPGADARLRQSVEMVVARVTTMAVYELYAYLTWISKQFLILTADADGLDDIGADYGMPRNQPTDAIGNVIFTGQDGSIVPAGTVMQRADNVEFTLNADVDISGTTGTGAVTAVVAGSAANSGPSTVITLESPVAGVNAAAAVDSNGLEGGADLEDDDDYRIRLLARRQEPPMGGSEADYIAWAKQVTGVTRVWVYPLQLGLGTVEVAFVCDNQAGSIIPSTQTVTAVQAAIDAASPVIGQTTVFAPTAVPQNFTIHLNPNTLVVQTAVQAELADFFATQSIPGGTLLFSQLDDAVGNATGVKDYVIITPSANIVMSFGQIATLGTTAFGSI